MMRRGTVVNGVIVPEGPPLPEGTQVVIDPCVEGLFTNETHEEFIESLRQSIAEAEAGEPGYTLEEVMSYVDQEIKRVAAEKKR